jgi:hypothetical protein
MVNPVLEMVLKVQLIMVNFDQHKAPVGIETHFHLLRRPQVVFLFWITFRVQKGSVVRNQLALGLGLTVVFLVFAASSTEWSHLGDVQETFRWNVLKDSLRMFAHKPMLRWGLALLMSSIPHTGASIQPSMSTPLTTIIFKS